VRGRADIQFSNRRVSTTRSETLDTPHRHAPPGPNPWAMTAPRAVRPAVRLGVVATPLNGEPHSTRVVDEPRNRAAVRAAVSDPPPKAAAVPPRPAGKVNHGEPVQVRRHKPIRFRKSGARGRRA
jgi:hypothetical protein